MSFLRIYSGFVKKDLEYSKQGNKKTITVNTCPRFSIDSLQQTIL